MLLKGKNVLIIEDNENDMKIAEAHLKTLKAKVFKSTTGENALDTFKKKDIDLILIDYRLPYKNGLMLTKEIKTIREVPIILITGVDEVIQDVDYVKKFGFDDVLCKPYHKADLVKIIDNIQEPVLKTKHTPTVSSWFITLCILIVVTVGSILFFQPPTPNSLFTQYYTSNNVIDQTRGNENVIDGIIQFEKRDFVSASTSFEKMIQKDSTNMTIWFYYGISNIETKNYDKSIIAFNKIIEQKDNLLIEHAEWYLGLCYLKNNQKDKAIIEFKKISSESDNYHCKDAKDILNKLTN